MYIMFAEHELSITSKALGTPPFKSTDVASISPTQNCRNSLMAIHREQEIVSKQHLSTGSSNTTNNGRQSIETRPTRSDKFSPLIIPSSITWRVCVFLPIKRSLHTYSSQFNNTIHAVEIQNTFSEIRCKFKKAVRTTGKRAEGLIPAWRSQRYKEIMEYIGVTAL